MTHPAVPSPIAVQDAIYASRNPTRRWLHQLRRDWIGRRIAQLAAGAARGLEIGAGSGQYTAALAQRCARLTVLDIELPYLQRARQVAAPAPIDCCQGDLLRPPLAAGSFDFILCSEVIEHLPPGSRAAAQLSALLKPGGVLILSTPQEHSLLESVARLALSPLLLGLTRRIYREPVQQLGHTNLLSRGALQEELAAAGFELVESECFGLYLPLLAEFGGVPGQRLIAWLDARCRKGRLASLLWTQAYVCRRPLA